MNYYMARQKETDKLWHYTCANDNRIWPVGYCAEGCPGHQTADEAAEHYRQYLLDKRLEFINPENPREQNKCIRCGAWTSGHALLDNREHVPLCPEHQTKEIAAEIFPTIHKIISSY